MKRGIWIYSYVATKKIEQCSNMVKFIELLLPSYRDEQIYNKIHCIPLASNRESHLFTDKLLLSPNFYPLVNMHYFHN